MALSCTPMIDCRQMDMGMPVFLQHMMMGMDMDNRMGMGASVVSVGNGMAMGMTMPNQQSIHHYDN